MPQAASAKLISRRRAKALLDERLRERKGEIEAQILARIEGDGAPTEAPDPEYADGLRRAVSVAIDYCLASIQGRALSAPVPVALLVQAQVAARNRIGLDTVLRRYFAGYMLLGDFLVEEAAEVGISSAELRSFLQALAGGFERLVATVGDEHGRRPGAGARISSDGHRAELVRRLLAGELLTSAELNYDLGANHIGAFAGGSGVGKALREIAGAIDCSLLAVRGNEGALWAWFGTRAEFDLGHLTQATTECWPLGVPLAMGEPSCGLAGWRLTHRQARAALPIALRDSRSITRYGDVALLASQLQDDLLVTSLRQIYLAPLTGERDGGKILRETLRAYFAAERNASSAAVALGISRQAVSNRLRKVEEALERPLGPCAGELQAALRFERLATFTSSSIS